MSAGVEVFYARSTVADSVESAPENLPVYRVVSVHIKNYNFFSFSNFNRKTGLVN
ncbi:hypothetical protein DSM03_102551 [Leeuwenhoekiella aestuarii]|uniref:Uncharacterized protein n=1 Tax=Leeuwenhoekiella aestuarii TaxID=2249426 RepID=A0A4Q0NUB5_9FLAO|nr:hypothetical protein DSM04_103103 [Leeuwenhoekiella aestuarii]RXG17674.1 hypothetical protein DSM03_102551 [Leeuwenhoekiella aestuarii]